MTARDDATRRNDASVQISAASVDDPGIAELLAFAVGDDDGGERLQRTVQRYRDEPTTRLLVARAEQHPAAVLGYTVTAAEVTVIHIAVAATARGTGIGTSLLRALRKLISAGLPIVAETDSDAVGFYRSNGFQVASLGEKYPGVERFRVTLGPTG